MRNAILLLLAVCVGGMASAGPNEGGVLIAHDANLLLSGTVGGTPICEQGIIPSSCPQADARIDGASATDPAIFKVYAAFSEGTSPRLMGVTWGVDYDNANLFLPDYGTCGDFELNENDWPLPGTGCAVTWFTVQTDYLVAIYWFAAYTYGAPGALELIPHPQGGGWFGDDSVPAVLDQIAAYGTLGFDMPGEAPCPPPQPQLGACCDCETRNCTLTLAEDCPPPNDWHPGHTTCDPNPCPNTPAGACCLPEGECVYLDWYICGLQGGTPAGCVLCDPNPCEPPPTPVESDSWGRIKEIYR